MLLGAFFARRKEVADRAAGLARVALPDALARKNPRAAQEFGSARKNGESRRLSPSKAIKREFRYRDVALDDLDPRSHVDVAALEAMTILSMSSYRSRALRRRASVDPRCASHHYPVVMNYAGVMKKRRNA